MYNVENAYPAVVFDGKYNISGQIHEYADEKEVIMQFDLIEGSIEKDYYDNLYNRKTIEVITEDGEKLDRISYEFNRGNSNLEILQSGFWLFLK